MTRKILKNKPLVEAIFELGESPSKNLSSLFQISYRYCKLIIRPRYIDPQIKRFDEAVRRRRLFK